MITAKQREIIAHDNLHQPRITILEGAVRSGKTVANIMLFAHHVSTFRDRNFRFIITGSSIPSVKRNVLDELERLDIGIFPVLNQGNEFRMMGNTINCFGAMNNDSYKVIKGFTAHGWLANEVTEHHINTIDQCFKRCSGHGARIFWDTNPAGPGHIVKTNYVDRDGEMLSDGRAHIKSWHFNLDDNNFLPAEYKESIKTNTPTGMWYDRDILGLWVAAEGMIYRDFDLGVHVIDVAPGRETFKEFIAGIDWGFEHRGVIGLYGIDGDGNLVRLLEVAEDQKTIEWWVAHARDLVNTYGNITFYADPARPDNIATFRKAGVFVREAENAVVEGITCVAEQFRRRRLFIVRHTNRNYLQEIYNYRWKPNAAKEEPIKEADHSMDSERYAIYSHIGQRNEIVATLSLYR